MTTSGIPLNTMPNITSAVADVVRAAAVWGAELTQGEPDERTYIIVIQYVGQLLTVLFQREPTPREMEMVFEALGQPR